jgi:peptide/nickel transport system substrate-binding protein
MTAPDMGKQREAMLEMDLTRRRLMRSALGAALLAPCLEVSSSARAQSGARLRIGLAAPNTTLDPHLQSNAPNNAVTTHIFDSVIVNDEALRSRPGLAASWRVLDDTHWEFTFQPNVHFSDGSPITAQDIAASIDRATTIPSTASFRTYTRSIKMIVAGAPNTFIIETKAPDPLLLNSLSRIRIISARYKDAPSSDFNSGKAAIGTGPYLFKEYVPGSHVLLVRNEGHWGPKPPWSEAILRIVAENGARIAGLLSGDLDLIEGVPSEGLDRVKSNDRLHTISGISSRLVYFGMDQGRDVTPFATDATGKPLERNPFRDRKVREAIDLAINRQAIVERVMDGVAMVATQYLPPGGFGTSPNIKPAPYDPIKAKALLAEAGYPNGFGLTIHGPNGRYVNDARIVQAVAQMLARIGIAPKVEIMPWAVYGGRIREFSFSLGSWGVNTGETSNPIVALNATYDKEAGTGVSNFGRYSDPKVDELVKLAVRTMDDDKRAKLLAEASEIVFADRAILPLHHEGLTWAARKNIQYTPRADQYTLAMGVTMSG